MVSQLMTEIYSLLNVNSPEETKYYENHLNLVVPVRITGKTAEETSMPFMYFHIAVAI